MAKQRPSKPMKTGSIPSPRSISAEALFAARAKSTVIPVLDAKGHHVMDIIDIHPIEEDQGEETMTKFSAAENDNLIRLVQLGDAGVLIVGMNGKGLTDHQVRVLRKNIDAEIKSRFESAQWFADKLLREERIEAEEGSDGLAFNIK